MNQDFNNFNTQNNMNNNINPVSSKKANLGLIIGIIGVVVVVVVIAFLLFNKSTNESNDNNSGNNITENNEQNKEDNNTISSEINKYWNIDTTKFNASLFDGKFSMGGEIIQSKLTGKTLQDNGYGLRIGSGLFTELLWDQDNNIYSDKSNEVYILKNNEEIQDHLHLANYKNETNLYSDNTEISYYWNDITKTYDDIIIPTSLITNLEDKVDKTLTIDKVVEKLGVPTYVQGRLTKTIDNGQFFKYVYVYNDYTLWFELLYYENTGISLTGFEYEGNLSFNQPCKYYDAELEEFRNYNNSLEYLKEEQIKYEKTL